MSSQLIGCLWRQAMPVSRNRHRQVRLGGDLLAQSYKIRMGHRFTASESQPETPSSIEFTRPGQDIRCAKAPRGFRGVAIRAGQLTGVRERDGDVAWDSMPLRGRQVHFLEQDVTAGQPVEQVEPVPR